MTVVVEHATADDAPVISELIEEIEDYYGSRAAPPAAERVERVRELLFADHPAARVLLAREGGVTLGIACYSSIWPAVGVTCSLYLKELYVREPGRRKGTARLLMEALRQAARDTGCSRIEWTADRDNPVALKFYESLGARAQDGKVFYRVSVPPGGTGSAG
ncbi:GNAT family N-acetyltransferase [Wenjunlia tyrosinilytica]|uniref:N-acetyltransferase n=1 Tax=Wenjunlia tyrosinilytica TaxID=1544741 RepID=A0A917ZD95_9ACTN|nr:GNAT family N-acetyltransferase [Wenjunlia tyrosinilytica]GGO80362.1 N-acetyltransferase [Wenjunlia tyrosinilytica]